MEQTPDVRLVNFIIKEIVENPDDVAIKRVIDEKGVLLMLTVNQADLGRVIGKSGGTVEGIRIILRTIGAKHNSHYSLKVMDSKASEA